MLELDNTTIYVLRNPSCRLINELLSPSALFFYLRTNCSCGLVHATISRTKAMANKLPSCCKYIRIVTAKNEFHPQNNTHERWMQPKYRNNASTTNRLVGKKLQELLCDFVPHIVLIDSYFAASVMSVEYVCHMKYTMLVVHESWNTCTESDVINIFVNCAMENYRSFSAFFFIFWGFH